MLEQSIPTFNELSISLPHPGDFAFLNEDFKEYEHKRYLHKNLRIDEHSWRIYTMDFYYRVPFKYLEDLNNVWPIDAQGRVISVKEGFRRV